MMCRCASSYVTHAIPLEWNRARGTFENKCKCVVKIVYNYFREMNSWRCTTSVKFAQMRQVVSQKQTGICVKSFTAGKYRRSRGTSWPGGWHENAPCPGQHWSTPEVRGGFCCCTASSSSVKTREICYQQHGSNLVVLGLHWQKQSWF